MTLKKLKPIINSQRNTVLIDYQKTLIPSDKKPPRRLFSKLKSYSGRSGHTGRITVRHRQSWNKKIYRIIDFRRNKQDNIAGKIKSIEFEPNRNCFISLVSYENGAYSYILSPEGLKVGDKIISGEGENVQLNNKTIIRIYPHLVKTKKPIEVCMGSGKGSPTFYVAVVKKGTVMFEIKLNDLKHSSEAKEALRQTIYKLQIKCQIVEKN